MKSLHPVCRREDKPVSLMSYGSVKQNSFFDPKFHWKFICIAVSSKYSQIAPRTNHKSAPETSPESRTYSYQTIWISSSCRQSGVDLRSFCCCESRSLTPEANFGRFAWQKLLPKLETVSSIQSSRTLRFAVKNKDEKTPRAMKKKTHSVLSQRNHSWTKFVVGSFSRWLNKQNVTNSFRVIPIASYNLPLVSRQGLVVM